MSAGRREPDRTNSCRHPSNSALFPAAGRMAHCAAFKRSRYFQSVKLHTDCRQKQKDQPAARSSRSRGFDGDLPSGSAARISFAGFIREACSEKGCIFIAPFRSDDCMHAFLFTGGVDMPNMPADMRDFGLRMNRLMKAATELAVTADLRIMNRFHPILPAKPDCRFCPSCTRVCSERHGAASHR